jgi:MOSC domain-containing protein YiiM
VRLSSVNIGHRRTQPRGAELEITGIYKRPTDGPLAITTLGLVDDFIGDARNHGGADQAVYIYGSADYDWWARELGHPIEPGTFGDNLTIDGLESALLNVGDRLHLGETILEVTAARIPCSTLSRRMGDSKFAAAFRNAERPGLYCRVISPGSIANGDPVRLEPYAGESVSVLEMFRQHYHRNKSELDLRRLLRAPISTRARRSLQAELDQLLAAPAA